MADGQNLANLGGGLALLQPLTLQGGGIPLRQPSFLANAAKGVPEFADRDNTDFPDRHRSLQKR